MNWFKEHADTLAILGAFAVCFWTMNGKMNDGFNKIDHRLTVIETVLIMKNIMPNQWAISEGKDGQNH